MVVEVRMKSMREKVGTSSGWEDCLEIDFRLEQEELEAAEMAEQVLMVKELWQRISPKMQ